MNRTKLWLVIFVAILGASIVSSCVFVPKCQLDSVMETSYQKGMIYGPDGEEIGHIMTPVRETIPDNLLPLLFYAYMSVMSVLLAFISLMGILYNIKRLQGWNPNDLWQRQCGK